MESSVDILEQYIEENVLPKSYISLAQRWFTPLAESLSSHHDSASATIFVGVNGTQGSGKSTLTGVLTELLTKVYGKKSIGISIDDYYLSKQIRKDLARSTHPLLATRGVPGTHDTALMHKTLNALLEQRSCALPIFNKATDDLLPASQWRNIESAYDIVILEGWCVGIAPQTQAALSTSVNALEAEKDSDNQWRNYVNNKLADEYRCIFEKIDKLVMLKAPSFNSVYQWRCEQEHKLIAKLSAQSLDLSDTMSDKEIYDFIQLYQRLTEHALLTLPTQADYVFELDANRGIQSCQTK